MIYMLLVIGSGLLAVALTYIGVAGIRHLAEHRKILDIPGVRSSHIRPMPRGGGLAIVIVVVAFSWLLWPFIRSETAVWQWLAYSAGALLIAGVSWLDDLRSLSTRVRLAVHLTGAILACLAFGAWKELNLPGVGSFSLGLWGWPLTLLWIIGLTNAYNFMDGIDGIAGGQAVVAGLGWAVLGWIGAQPLVSAAGMLVAAASLGFLGHNWPPAKIFMGDVGSSFLGYTFAVLPVIAACGNTTCGDTARSDPRFVLIGVLLVWPFVFDAAFTFLRRLRKRENVFSAHRSHLYQRLVISGLSHRVVDALYIALALTGVVPAAAFMLEWRYIGIAALAMLIIAAIGLWFLTVRRERMGAGKS